MKLKLGNRTKFILRYGIAAFGITFVLILTSFHDYVMILKDNGHRVDHVSSVQDQNEGAAQFQE